MPVNPPPPGILAPNPFWKSCDEMFDGRTGIVYSLEGNRQYVRKFLVIVKLKEMAPVMVALCPGIPKAGEHYIPQSVPGVVLEEDLLALCTEIRADPLTEGDWAHWVVTCTYNTRFNTRAGRNPQQVAASANDPTQEFPEVEWTTEMIRDNFIRDLYGIPVFNTARQPLVPGISRELPCPVLVISRNELSFDYQKANKYAMCLNKLKFLNAPPGCVQVAPITSRQKNKGSLEYNRTTYRLRFRPLQDDGTYTLPKINILLAAPGKTSPLPQAPINAYYLEAFEGKEDQLDSWQPLILNQGMYRVGGTEPGDPAALVGKPTPITFGGQPVHHNMCLNDKGGVVSTEDGGTVIFDLAGNPSGHFLRKEEPWWIQFRAFRIADLTDLLKNGVQ